MTASRRGCARRRACRVAFPRGGRRSLARRDGVSFERRAPGETLGLVGESGSGKSVTLRALLRLVPDAGRGRRRRAAGRRAATCCALSERELRSVRGREIAMIFQDPTACLNPVLLDRRPAHRDAARQARGLAPRGRARARGRAARPRRHPVGRGAAARLPAPAQRRHAPARDDRDRARLRAARCCSPTSRRRRST